MTSLHPRLAADTLALTDNDFCWIRYANDQRFAWIIIVPKQAGLREWFELSANDQIRLLNLANQIGSCLQRITKADKINLGALGNQVPQLHVHVIARHQDDACWPGAVWGCGQAEPFNTPGLPGWATELLADLTVM